jgi:hypothetical protein
MSPAAPHAHDDVEARVLAVIARAMDRPVSDVTPESSLEEDLGAQSLDFLDIASSAFSSPAPISCSAPAITLAKKTC